ncbi:hypothetical protein [Kitasatospora purpeofusca]|uniref:Rv1733c family protein n=1 Tax=Kitasatospora purpeofusca TaxID=67352 RepID=UPI002A5A476A|nr:hypothetical protein [Kitasatospora purpeofusca]MDY0816663.1 hypothetical protein [Kitasatospora purpeofusca]
MNSTHQPEGPPAPPCGHLRRTLGRERNPVSRAVDRARSRAVVLTVLGVVLAGLLGAGAAAVRLTAEQQRTTVATALLYRVEALVAGSARKAEATVFGGRTAYRADAAWDFPAGRTNTGVIDVPRNTEPGAAIGIWVDRDGHLAATPPSTTSLVADAVCLGLFLFGLLSVLAAAGLRVRLSALDRRADRAWTRAWARLEPVWSGRAPRDSHQD